MVNPLDLVLPHIKALQPYSSARDEFSGSADIYLDANENALGSQGIGESWHRYPDPHAQALKGRLASIYSVEPANLFVGNGSDEAIDLLFRAFCAPGVHKALIMPPTYGMYQVSAGINNIEVVKVPLTTDFELDHQALEQTLAADPSIRLAFICSPNNPTGNLIALSEIEQVLSRFQGILVVDEAYFDFVGTDSATTLLGKYNNLVVIKTLSKAWGLAALRMGLAIGAPEVIEILNRVKPPYNLSGPSQQLALEALTSGHDKMLEAVAELNRQRLWLHQELLSISSVSTVYDSAANFLLVKFKPEVNATALYRWLTEKGVVVRDRSSQQHCDNCLRITVGTAFENQKLIEWLYQYR